MATPEEKALKKEKEAAEKELRMAGVVPVRRNFHLDAGRRVLTAWAWIPRLKWITAVASMVSVGAFLGVVFSVFSRPPAMAFLSFPDGTIACTPLSDAQGNPFSRKRSQQALCDRLRPPLGADVEKGVTEESLNAAMEEASGPASSESPDTPSSVPSPDVENAPPAPDLPAPAAAPVVEPSPLPGNGG